MDWLAHGGTLWDGLLATSTSDTDSVIVVYTSFDHFGKSYFVSKRIHDSISHLYDATFFM